MFQVFWLIQKTIFPSFLQANISDIFLSIFLLHYRGYQFTLVMIYALTYKLRNDSSQDLNNFPIRLSLHEGFVSTKFHELGKGLDP